MGVIRRQSLKHSAVNLLGLILGAGSTLFVYPHALEAYGLMQMLLQVGMVGLPVLGLGANTVAIRYFPRFYDKEKEHHGFLPLLLTLCVVGSAATWLVIAIGVWLWPSGLDYFTGRSPLLQQYGWLAAPLSFFFVVSTVLSLYSSNFKRIVVPSLLLDFSQKLVMPLLLIAVWQQWLPLEAALGGMLAHAVLVSAGLFLYLRRLGEWRWGNFRAFLTPELRRDLFRFIGFGVLGGFALQLASKVDILFVGSLGTLTAAGIYSIAAYLAAAIDIPTRGLYTASASSVARLLADGNMAELERLYQKVSVNLLLAGLLLFGSIWVSVDSFFGLIPNGEAVSAGKWVIFFIGISRLVEMGTGLNNYLIYYSQYYRYAVLSLGFFGLANVGMNLWLVPRLGLEGAAIATLMSVTLYNAFSVLFVWLKFRLQPFGRQTAYAIITALVVYFVCNWTPRHTVPLLDVALHSGLFAVLFGAAAYTLRLSTDVNEMVQSALSRLRGGGGKGK